MRFSPIVPIILCVALLGAGVPALAGGLALTDGFVGCSTSDNCYPFDLDTHVAGAAIDLLPEGNYPYDATITPDGSQVWITGASGDGVIVIDRASNSIVTKFTLADYVIGVAFNNDGTRALVTSRGDQCVKVLDTSNYAVVGTLPIPTDYLGAGNIALDPVSGTFYLTDWYNDLLYEIAADGSAILRQDDFGTSLWQVVVAPDGGHVYVTDRGTDTVVEIDTGTFTPTRSFHVGDDPWGLDITADGATLVVTCEDSHEIDVIDVASGSVTPIIPDASADPRDVDILDDAGVAFVTGGAVSGASALVYVVDLATATVIDSFDGPGTNSNVIAVQAQMHAGGPTAVPGVPAAAVRLAAYPNPFNPLVKIELQITAPATATLDICDVAGRRVRNLLTGSVAAGTQVWTWDGCDGMGRAVPSGTYLVNLRAAKAAVTQKIMLAR